MSVFRLSNFDELLHSHAGGALDKQLHLSDLVDGLEWELALEEGELRYVAAEGEVAHRFSVQLLGSQAQDRFLWAWANPSLAGAEPLTSAARRLRSLGAELQVPELRAPWIEAGQVEARHLALVASGACRAVAFFRAPLDHSVLYCLLTGPALPEGEQPAGRRVQAVFPRLLREVPLRDERLAFIHYLRFHAMRVEERLRSVSGWGRGGDEVYASFDDARRMRSLRLRSN